LIEELLEDVFICLYIHAGGPDPNHWDCIPEAVYNLLIVAEKIGLNLNYEMLKYKIEMTPPITDVTEDEVAELYRRVLNMIMDGTASKTALIDTILTIYALLSKAIEYPSETKTAAIDIVTSLEPITARSGSA